MRLCFEGDQTVILQKLFLKCINKKKQDQKKKPSENGNFIIIFIFLAENSMPVCLFEICSTFLEPRCKF